MHGSRTGSNIWEIMTWSDLAMSWIALQSNSLKSGHNVIQPLLSFMLILIARDRPTDIFRQCNCTCKSHSPMDASHMASWIISGASNMLGEAVSGYLLYLFQSLFPSILEIISVYHMCSGHLTAQGLKATYTLVLGLRWNCVWWNVSH